MDLSYREDVGLPMKLVSETRLVGIQVIRWEVHLEVQVSM
jgi:hypothetical protein